jgi:hypothetical protein
MLFKPLILLIPLNLSSGERWSEASIKIINKIKGL